MANHNLSWVLGVHMCFGDLDFIITMEGELVWAPVVVQPLHSTGLDTNVEALKELQLHAPKAHTPTSDRLLGFDYERLERQLGAFLGPDRPRRTYATSPPRLPMSWYSLPKESHSLWNTSSGAPR